MVQPSEELIEELKKIKIPEELVRMGESRAVNIKTTQPTEVAFTIHKGSYSEVGEAIQRLMQWIIANGYQVAGPPVNVFHNDPIVTPEDELITEVQFPIRKRS